MVLVEYILVLFIGLIGGAPLVAKFAEGGFPEIGFIIWFGILLFAVYAVCSQAYEDYKYDRD